MRVWALMLVVAVLSAPSAQARRRTAKAKAPKVVSADVALPARQPGAGQVTFVTKAQAFVDRGAADQLAVGQSLSFGKRVKCVVASVAEHSATCVGAGVRVGDRFVVKATERTLPPMPEPPPGPEVLRARLAQMEQAEVPLHDFDQAPGVAAGLGGVMVRLRHDGWWRGGGPFFQRERVDVRLDGLPLFLGVRAWLDASVWVWSQRPAGARYPVGPVQPVVRRAELAHREPGRAFAFAVGRTWPVAAPGVVMVDGAQGSYRGPSDQYEIGVYGGALPDDLSLVPSARFTAGAFGRLRLLGAAASGKGLFGAARAAFVTVPGAASRIEGHVSVRGWLGQGFDGALELLASAPAGQGPLAPGAIDGARLALGFRPHEVWSVRIDGRYQSGTGSASALTASVVSGRSYRAGVEVGFEPFAHTTVLMRGSLVRNLDAGTWQNAFGPAVVLGFGAVGVELSYAEEMGWLPGRTAGAGVWVQPSRGVRLQARGSWFEQVSGRRSAGFSGREFGSAVLADVAVLEWLSARAQVMGRYSPTGPAGQAWSLSGSLELVGRFSTLSEGER